MPPNVVDDPSLEILGISEALAGELNLSPVERFHASKKSLAFWKCHAQNLGCPLSDDPVAESASIADSERDLNEQLQNLNSLERMRQELISRVRRYFHEPSIRWPHVAGDSAPWHRRHNFNRDATITELRQIRDAEIRRRETGEVDLPDEPRLIVDLPRKVVILDGTEHDVSSEQALRWVNVLASMPGEWIPGKDLEHYDASLIDVRTDKLKKYLPAEVLDLIESLPSKGSRLKLA